MAERRTHCAARGLVLLAAMAAISGCGLREYVFVDGFDIDRPDARGTDGSLDTTEAATDAFDRSDIADRSDAADVPPDICPTHCGGVCTDTSSDPANCGACGRMCATGGSCTAGTCTCPVGNVTCNGACVDVQSDPANCGTCGLACAPGMVCASGMCGCTGGLVRCFSACVNTAADPRNCGACGRSVCNDNVCVGGMPQCAPGYTACGGSAGCGPVCVNLATDVNNCGVCGRRCGNLCSAGVCSFVCPAGRTTCNRGCVDVNTDLENCGACGNICGRAQVCVGGRCQAYTPAPCTSCPCAACGSASTCCDYPAGQPVCVTGTGCPLP